MNRLGKSLRFLAGDLLPRYKAPIAKRIKVLANHREYRRRRMLAESASSPADPLAAGLVQDGYAYLESSAVDTTEVASAGATRLAESQRFLKVGQKLFFSELLSEKDRAYSSPFMRFALKERLLRSVAGYLGCAPYLEYVNLLHSKPSTALASSQLWHKDRTDHALVKIFIYCSDVSPENGPFTFLSRQHSAQIPDFLPHYLMDQSLQKHVPLDRAIRFTGPAGSALMIDTKHCYHFGSRCEKTRLAYVCYYSSGLGYYARETKWKPDDFPVATLSPLQKMALGFWPDPLRPAAA